MNSTKTSISGDQIWPMLINGQHVVSYRDLRRMHGDDGARIWARAVAENALVSKDSVRWSFYERFLKNDRTNI